ncbi:hypothetical protein [Paenibacillus sp. LHD-38]|uniref:hypothetical protein n=1 Tax=Paenibacillus sp. LHD-38 TaxID=3072143 RepID=UPI00280D1A18|nr:hypothetical protein [Paenibacillus sp. LHD-38]MDQ8734376.1 hypothetical protein [Paenibacillus sp. LHD-38]
MRRTSIATSLTMTMMIIIQMPCSAEMMSPQRETYPLIQSIAFTAPNTRVMHKAELFGPIIGFPRGRILKIDSMVVDENQYETSRIMLGDVTEDHMDEVFFYQYSTGSAGAMGLNVYSLVKNKWIPIFTDPSRTLANDDYDRFSSEYIGHGSLRFYDKRTRLSGVLDMSGFHFSEERLSKMKFQTDPISEYAIHYENIGCGIETVQWVFAFSHPASVFTVHSYYRYKFDEKTFALYETKIQDEQGRALAAKIHHD